MADYNMGGMPPMGLPMGGMPGGMPPMGGGFGEMLSYNPGWFYGATAAVSSSARRDKRLFSSINSLDKLYKNKDKDKEKKKIDKIQSSISKSLNEVNQLIRDHTKLARYNYAKYLVLEKIAELEKTYGDMPFPSKTIDAEQIQKQVDEALSKSDIKISQDELPSFKLGFAFNFNSFSNENEEMFSREFEKNRIKLFIHSALNKRKNRNWRNDTARKCSLDFEHSVTCLTGFLYHNYNVYNTLLGNISIDSFVSATENIKKKIDKINVDDIFKPYEELLKESKLGKEEEKVNLFIASIEENMSKAQKELNDIDLNALFGPPAVKGMLPDPTDYNDLYMTYVDSLSKKIADLKRKINKNGRNLINKFETLVINEQMKQAELKKNSGTQKNSNDVDSDEKTTENLNEDTNTTDNVNANNESVQNTPVQPEPVQNTPVQPEPVQKTSAQPEPVQRKTENTTSKHRSSDNVIRIKQEDLDFWRNLIDDYFALQGETKENNQFVPTPEIDRDMQLVDMLSNIEEDEIDFTDMKGFKK